MRVLLDEHISPLVAEMLRSRGLDATAVSERADLRGVSDERLLDLAAAEGRAIVTNNVKDFRVIAGARLAAGRGHAGLICVASARDLSRSATSRLANAIELIMGASPDGIGDSERWLPPLA